MASESVNPPLISTGTPHPFLRPLSLPGGRVLPNRILPGPMEGITGGAFCAVLSRLGYVRCWITPFIRVSTGVARPARLGHRLQPYVETGLPVIAQVMGTDAGRLAETAARLAALGAVGIDLNCGCPSRTVVASGAGGACLRRPEWIAEALRAMRRACPTVGISVKVRTGIADPAEMRQILPAVRAGEPDVVTVHFRTVAEQYGAVPGRLERLAEARALLPGVVLLASGDLFHPDDALQLRDACGVDGVTPARGLLRNPRLLRDIEDACAGLAPVVDTLARRAAVLGEIAAACRGGPPGLVIELARHMFGAGHAVFRALAACRTADAATRVLADEGLPRSGAAPQSVPGLESIRPSEA